MRQRRPRVKSEGRLNRTRALPCVICGGYPSDPAHLRAPSLDYGKRYLGKSEKPDDRWVNTLCRPHHDDQHQHGDECDWWALQGIDPFATSTALYEVTGDYDAALRVISEARP